MYVGLLSKLTLLKDAEEVKDVSVDTEHGDKPSDEVAETEDEGEVLALLKIDFKNAFNLVDRRSFMTLTCQRFPALSAWTNWCYSSPSVLLYDHQDVILSESGVQQGDPLGPLYFCFGLAPLVEEIASLNPLYNKW